MIRDRGLVSRLRDKGSGGRGAMTTAVRDRVLEWITSPDTCYLVGAGCSRCAGKPLIGALTTGVLSRVDPKIKAEFDRLKGGVTRPPTIEDLINYLIRYQSILATVRDTTGHALDSTWIDSSLTKIKKEIVREIVDNW